MWKAFGPGILFAASAVGTSHIVQSTRAGADFSMGLIFILVLIAALKYPASRFGRDYATATGKSLIHNYAGYGWPVMMIYVMVVGMSMAFTSAALAMVNASILKAGLPIDTEIRWLALSALIVSTILLLTGRYKFLEKLNKFLVPAFTVLVFITTVIVAFQTEWSQLNWSFPAFNSATLVYIVSIAGWLLAPLDISVFLSLWTLEKSKTGELDESSAALDFNIGYWGSLVLAMCFLLLGASLLGGSGEALPKQGGAFITEMIKLFSDIIGDWSFPLIAFMAFSIMYSTLLTVMDGYSRVVEALLDIGMLKSFKKNFELGVCAVVASSVLVILLFMKSFTTFIDLVGVLVFVLGPVYAILNHRAIFGRDVSLEEQPSSLMRFGSWCGIIIMSVVAIAYCYLRWGVS